MLLMTLEHKTSLKSQFLEIKIYASSEKSSFHWRIVYDRAIFENLRVQKKSKYWENHL